MIKIYLAGPDVFRENAVEHLQELKDLCTKYGFEGLSPFDNDSIKSEEIFAANCKLIDECDIVVANLLPFRGPTVDDGTAFEIGYAFAKGKVIYGYTTLAEFSLKNLTEYEQFEDVMMLDFPIIEDFELPVNLMLNHAIECTGGKIETDFEKVLMTIKTNVSR